MAARYLTELFTPEVRAAQTSYLGRAQRNPEAPTPDALGENEAAFVASRDSFYFATLSSSGFPYVQHRGGPAGFLRVLDPHTLAFPDFKGNRQLLSTGNLAASDKVSLLLMDYPQRLRLKILGHARVHDVRSEPALLARLELEPALATRAERVFEIHVVGFDWNCPAYITPRYTAEEVASVVAPLRARIAELEAQLEE